MPSVAELHAQALFIRESGKVWNDPDLQDNLRETDPISARVLQRYIGSINELARSNARIDSESEAPVRRESDEIASSISKLSDAAPIETGPDYADFRAPRPTTRTE